MKSLKEFVNEGYTLKDIDKVTKPFADFRKKQADTPIKNLVGQFLSSLHQYVNKEDKDMIKEMIKAIENL
ncbi:MAG: hypothetical protein J1F35_08680 [Erysipelotrichales bacterium]|nr:hypothetical protein [Erysipelotrichales bacterium]